SAVLLVDEQDAVAELVGHVQVGPAVVVGVEPDGAEGRAEAAAGAGGLGHILELPVALVAPQLVAFALAALAVDPGVGLAGAGPGDIQVEAAVAVVVRDGDAAGAG